MAEEENGVGLLWWVPDHSSGDERDWRDWRILLR